MFPDTSVDAALTQLEPYHDELREIFSRAIAKFNSIEPALLLPLTRWNRSRCTCIWAYVMEELETAFPSESGVKLDYTQFETIEIHFGANLVARLKKMTAAGFTSNYPTGRATAFHSEDQGELFVLTWAKPLRVDIGYVPNATGTGIERVMVARRKTPKVMDWVYTIEAPDSGEPIPLERRPLPADGAARVQARNGGGDTVQREPTGTEQ